MLDGFPDIERDGPDACLASEEWRIRNLYMWEDMDTGKIVAAKLRPEQSYFLDHNHTRNFILKCRKIGFSTFEIIRALDKCIFNVDESGRNGNFLAALIDKGLGDAEKKLNIARVAWKEGINHPDQRIAAIWLEIRRRVTLIVDNQSEMRWSNGSSIQVGTSFRGGTPRQLHISEFGYIAANTPEKAIEIVDGAINAVPPTGRITIETTHEGGRWGKCFDMAEIAMGSKGKQISSIDWKFFFFPWYEHPSYKIQEDEELTSDLKKYFDELENNPSDELKDYFKRIGSNEIPRERKNWYAKTYKVLQFGMFKEFPTTESEAFMSQIQGAIYPEMITLRAKGRVMSLTPEQGCPLHIFCDIGISDFMAAWLAQITPMARMFHDHYEREGINAYTLAAKIHEWHSQFCRDADNPVPMGKVFLPHDADKRAPGDGKTFKNHLEEGLKNQFVGLRAPMVVVVPRTSDIWNGISAVRRLVLPNAYFDPRCDVSRKVNGINLPSGIGCLQGYHKQPPGASGSLREEPAHDLCSHSADAFRTCGEAMERNMLQTANNYVPAESRPRDTAGRLSGAGL